MLDVVQIVENANMFHILWMISNLLFINCSASRTSTRIIETTSSDYDAYILRCRECVDIS